MSLSNFREPPYPQQTHQINHEVLLRRIIYRIRQSLDLQVILDTTAHELQKFLAVDRVKIYQFHADQSGYVVAEACSLDCPLPSLKDLNFPADDIPPEARQLFVEARVRNIVDVESGIIGQSRQLNPETGKPIAEDWVYRPLDPCHAEYLTTMGVKASVVSPISHGEHLWGLLVIHHTVPRELNPQQIEAMQLVVGQLSMAISQANLLTKTREHAARESVISQVTVLLNGLTTLDLASALEKTTLALQGVGSRLFIPALADSTGIRQPDCSVVSNALHVFGIQPVGDDLSTQKPMELRHGIQAHLKETNDAPWAVDDVFEVSSLRNLQLSFQRAGLRGWLMIPLKNRQHVIAYLSIFRPARETETLWAGKFDPDTRQDFPRQSFEIWRHTQQGQIYPWGHTDVDLATSLGTQFAIAIEQHRLYQEIQTLNNSLEKQVQTRTAELQKTLKDLQQAQTQLIHTEKMSSLGQLVAGIAHEINNPINFIHGNLTHLEYYATELLELLALYQQHVPEPNTEIFNKSQSLDLDFVAQDFPKILASMAVGTKRIQGIVLSLRSFSRLDQAAKKAVDLHEGIESTLMILQHRLQKTSGRKAIQIVKEYGDLPLVECLASQLNQVFMNILSNAIDALETINERRLPQTADLNPPTIRIHTAQLDDHWVAIQISDNGQGIPQDIQARLFNPFFTTKPVGKGTGLGLSISHQIVVGKHGGKLECVSSPGQGTTFTITIPVN
ncbi:MAG: ATP-binding protein [Cyanobacteria bacterium P01_A01_bin.123]